LIAFEDLIIPDSTKVVANQISANTTVLGATWTKSKPLRLVAELDVIDSKWCGCVSFGLVSPEEWDSKTGKWACDRETLEKRVTETRRWSREKMRRLSLSRSHATTSNGEDFLPQGDCVQVMYGGFLHLTEDWEGFDIKAGEPAYPKLLPLCVRSTEDYQLTL